MSENELFIKRLKEFIRFKNLKEFEFENAAGLSASTISSATKNNGSFNFNNIRKILLSFPELSADWLVTGRGSMITDNPAAVASEPVQDYNTRAEPGETETEIKLLKELLQEKERMIKILLKQLNYSEL